MGWGGDDDVSFTCTHVTCYGCYAIDGEGWVGGVGMMTFLLLCTHVTCYGREVSCIYTHVTCYAIGGEGWVGGGGYLHTCDMFTKRAL